MKSFVVKIRWIVNKTKVYFPSILLIIIIGAITSFISIYRALATKWIVDAATSASVSKIYKLLALLGIIIISDIVLRGVNSIIIAKTYSKVSNKMQSEIYIRILQTKWLQFLKYHSGDYVTRITNDVDTITNMVVNTIPNIIALIFLLIGSFIAIIKISLFLAIIIAIVIPVVFLIARYYSSKMKKIYLKSQKLESTYRSFITESIQNLLVVKTFCLEKTNINKIESLQNQRLKLVSSRAWLSAISNFVMSIGASLGFFIIFIWGSLRISNGTTTFGTLMALVQLVGNIQSPLSALAASLPQIVYAVAASERLIEIENLTLDSEEIVNKDFSSAGIVFENVDFRYKEDAPILRNTSIDIKPGETIAMMGPSGEGKTTFIYLLISLITPNKGHVSIYHDKEKIEVCADTRKFISYVPQGNTLFSGTISDNLRFGYPNATDKELEIAAKAACAWDFIKNSPEGLNTHVGERGSGLSEGQAQRLAIARALLRKAPILILDEATSALDTKIEIEVLKTIKNLKPAPTCIIITHRTTALEICNKVFKLEDCHVIEQSSSIEESSIFSGSVAATI